jgi:hypothetical protein
MDTDHHIRYCKGKDVDIARWDDCVGRSANRLIYGLHFYLDAMTAGQWDALILDDYRAVMPLTWRRKFGISYLAQPAFTQQLGVFSPDPLTAPLILSFLQEAARHYRFAEIYLNYANACPGLEPRTNLVLSLDKPYPQLAAEYNENLRRNLRYAAEHSLLYTDVQALAPALAAYRTLYGHRTNLHDDHYRRFEQLCRQTQSRLILRAVTDPYHQPLAYALLLTDADRLYLLQSTALPQGRNSSANHFLLDQLIREFAGRPLLLDFEGSDHPGVAFFYAGFGSASQPYFFCRLNRLPFPANFLKGPASAIPRQGQDPPAT